MLSKLSWERILQPKAMFPITSFCIWNAKSQSQTPAVYWNLIYKANISLAQHCFHWARQILSTYQGLSDLYLFSTSLVNNNIYLWILNYMKIWTDLFLIATEPVLTSCLLSQKITQQIQRSHLRRYAWVTFKISSAQIHLDWENDTNREGVPSYLHSERKHKIWGIILLRPTWKAEG